MPEQLESLPEQQEQDGESAQTKERIAVATLLAKLNQQYDDETAALDTEHVALEQEHAAIEEKAHDLEELLPARQRVSAYEADKLLLEGKIAESQLKRAESEQAKNAPAMMRQRQDEISARLTAIEGEKKAIARRTFDQQYEGAQSIVRAGERALIDTLKTLVEGFYAYEARTNTQLSQRETGLVKAYHIENLTGDERGTWGRLNHWYGGRGCRR